MRSKRYTYPIKINLDMHMAAALEALHDESGWQKNHIVRLGLGMFITEYRRLGIGKELATLRTADFADRL